MYKSPIEVYQSEIETYLEGEILKAVQRVGVYVDKEELLKALKYDREQYDKGYEDGLNADKWIPCSERLPEVNDRYWVCDKYYNEYSLSYDVNRKYFYKRGYDDIIIKYPNIIAWHELPQRYKPKGE